MTKEALKLALDFIENSEVGTADLEAHIKEALAQPEQEPVAFFNPQKGSFHWAKPTKVIPPITVDVKPLPLYATLQRTWVGLTDDEITELRLKTLDAVATNHEVYRAIEAKLKEKNT